MAIDHDQRAKTTEAGDDVFGTAVAEVFEVRIATRRLNGSTAIDGRSLAWSSVAGLKRASGPSGCRGRVLGAGIRATPRSRFNVSRQTA
jgi:hypothetical protein